MDYVLYTLFLYVHFCYCAKDAKKLSISFSTLCLYHVNYLQLFNGYRIQCLDIYIIKFSLLTVKFLNTVTN